MLNARGSGCYSCFCEVGRSLEAGINGEGVAQRTEENLGGTVNEVQVNGEEENEVRIDASVLLAAPCCRNPAVHDDGSNTRGSEARLTRMVEDHASTPGIRLEEARDGRRTADGSTHD